MLIPLATIAVATALCAATAWAVNDDRRVAAINQWLEQRRRHP